MMKKLVSLVLALTFIFTLTACSGKDMGRVKYNLDMEDFIELGKYEGIKIDKNGDEYKTIYSQFKQSDIETFDLYAKVTEGTLKKGDVANISYVGKLNGVAFQGGSADYYDLELGSNEFIPGFEEGLIGKEIGKTVDLNLTFPKDYGNTELAGKAVVFTVKINYVSIYNKTYEGTMKNGDTVNMDIVLKVGEKEIEKQTVTIQLGSNQASTFEQMLIGAKIGDTVEKEITYPSDYSDKELAGKKGVYLVKGNYSKEKVPQTPEEYYAQLGHKTVADYYKSLERRTLENIIMTKLIAESKVTEYPEEELKAANEKGKIEFEKNLQAYYGSSVTLEYYLTATNMTDEQFEEELRKNFSEPLLKEEMILYAVFDKAGLKIDKDELKKKTKEIVASYKSADVTEKSLKDKNGKDYFEGLYIQEKALDYIIKKANFS